MSFLPLLGKRPKKEHPFARVSKRGRAAYLILCFEECLQFYKETLDEWKWILEELWEITSTRDIDRWVFRVYEMTAEAVLPHASYEEMLQKVKAAGLWYELDEKDFLSLQGLYQRDRENFQVISDLLDRIYLVIVDDWGDGEEAFTPSCLHNIDEAEETMKSHRIPLPSDPAALEFIMGHRDKHYGKPFEGRRFSAICTDQ